VGEVEIPSDGVEGAPGSGAAGVTSGTVGVGAAADGDPTRSKKAIDSMTATSTSAPRSARAIHNWSRRSGAELRDWPSAWRMRRG